MADTTDTPKPLRRDAAQNRRRLLDAAREVFAEQGLEATMDEIAERASLGVGTAYRRFANKDELLEALFRERIEELDEIMDRAGGADDPWQGIVSYLSDTVALTAGDRGLRELMLSPPEGLDFVDEARLRLGPKVDELVVRAHDAGSLRAGVGSSDLVMIVLMLAPLADHRPDQADPAWHRFFELLVGGLRDDAGDALPGAALSPAEADDLMKGEYRNRRRSRP